MEAKLDQFTAWFVKNGGYIHESAELAFSEERGVHLRKKQNTPAIPVGSKIVQCPHKLSLSALDEHFSDSIKFSKDFMQNARPQLIGVACLLRESVDASSYWKPYIDILPTNDLTTPLYFQDKDKVWLKGTNVEKGALDLQRLWEAEFNQWQKEMSNNTDICFDHAWRSFRWGMSMFTSRAFPSRVIAKATGETSHKFTLQRQELILKLKDPDVLLFPMIDSINHNPNTHNTWGYDECGFWIVCNDNPGASDEIFHSYGEKTNDQLFLSYGFVLKDNIYDGYALKLRADIGCELSVVARNLLRQRKTAQDIHYILPVKIESHSGYAEAFCRSIPKVLLNFLFLVNAENEEIHRLEEHFTEYQSLIDRNELIDLGLRNRLETIDIIIEYLALAKSRIEETNAQLPYEPENANQEIARQYRATQLLILTDNIVELEVWMKQAERRWEAANGS